ELSLPLDPPDVLAEGSDQSLHIQVNYAAWLAGMNIRTDDTTTLQTTFVNNMTNAFDLIELVNRLDQ
ncbi:MAG: hypothetical protein D6772_07655, partial [Bacteroidetes bacterium]